MLFVSSAFEARYLDRLVRPWPEERDLYDGRSPLQHADQIRCPSLSIQGLQGKVVSPQQTERMAAALHINGINMKMQLLGTNLSVLKAVSRYLKNSEAEPIQSARS